MTSYIHIICIDKTTPAPLSAGSCDFEPSEDHLCGYEQDNKIITDAWGFSMVADDFDWSLNRGNTSSGNTGPTTDHTTRNGEGKTVIPLGVC